MQEAVPRVPLSCIEHVRFQGRIFGFNKELKTFMVKNTFKEKCPLYFTAMTRHSIVIEQYMEP